MYFISEFLLLVSATAVLGHMEVTSPAPRRSQYLKGYNGPVDYNMNSPLGGAYSFPCRGFGPGPSAGTFQAGSSVPIKIGGGASHNGGHCQFSVTYDNKNFAVLKTVMGNCLTGSLNYDVPLPKDSPNGKATLAWTWINRTGNREYYMNCIDIEINGGSNNGKITGPQMLVADLPGYTTFPEGFSDNYGKELFDKQPVITVSPNGSAVDPNPKPEPSTKPSPVPSSKPTNPIPSSNPVPEPSSSKPTPVDPKPKPTSQPENPNEANCEDGKMYCAGDNVIAMCFRKQYWKNNCAPGTTCKGTPGSAQCS